MSIIKELQKRGLLTQSTNGVDEHLNDPRVIYCGFDPTADSLHIGSLVPLITMKRFQDHGHKPILLVGGATGLIGDPSFKSQERSMNEESIVQEWTNRLKNQVKQFVDIDNNQTGAKVVNNFAWFQNVSIIDFLRETGKHFSVNAMIQKESVKQRLERDGEGISFTEFAYMLMQSQDFAELNKHHNCTVQVGGSDQWGNIVGGIDLTRRQNGEHVFGVTLPLVTKSDGTKFGKTEQGTIWLDPKKTSPFQFFQFWMNTTDEDVFRFMKFFTFLSVEEIEKIEQEDMKRKEKGQKPKAQEVLAEEVTALVHGLDAMHSAKRISKALFEGGVSKLTDSDIEQLELDGMESSVIDKETPLIEMIADISGMAKSRKMAREHIGNNAVKINDVVCNDIHKNITQNDTLFNRFVILKVGKKKHHLFIIADQ